MSDWTKSTACYPPTDGREILAAWVTERRPRILRKVWIDENGHTYSEPEFWQQLPQGPKR